MNRFTGYNSLKISNYKICNPANGKKDSRADPAIKAHKWPFGLLETSPISSAPPAQIGAKRKKRQNWSKESTNESNPIAKEDELLVELVQGSKSEELKWPPIAVRVNAAFSSSRSGKQCRERWLNHLRPDIKKGNWSQNETLMIEYFYDTFGPRWSTMAKLMKNRTDNDIKNKWNSMRRAEKASQKRKNDPVRRTNRVFGRVVEEKGTKQVEKPRWNATEETGRSKQETNGENQLFMTKENLHSRYASEILIRPTVTDGGSAENSPLPKNMYVEFEI